MSGMIDWLFSFQSHQFMGSECRCRPIFNASHLEPLDKSHRTAIKKYIHTQLTVN